MNEVIKWRNDNRNRKRLLIIGFASGFSPASDELLSKPIEQDPEALIWETRLIIATPVIETGKTITTLYQCIDMGLYTSSIANPLVYDINNTISFLKQIPVNINQSIQRLGRVGRECPGRFLHFFTKDVMSRLQLNDTAETINNSYLSNVLITHFKQFKINTYFDVINENGYLYPISVDTYIRTMNDMINAGIFDSYGNYLNLKTCGELIDIWLVYASYLYYILKYPLYVSLILAAVNRKSIPQIFSVYNFDMKNLKYDINSILKSKDDQTVIEGIQLARNTFTSIKYINKNSLIKYIKDKQFGNAVYRIDKE